VKKIKFIFLLVILITSTVIGLFFWDKIFIPPDKYLVGYEAIETKNYHPQTDTLRFVIFIVISLIPFYIYFAYANKINTFSIKEIINLDLTVKKKNDNSIFNFAFFFLLTAVVLSFFLINFENFINGFDIFHEGLWLTPSSNYLFTGGFWSSSFIERGLFGNYFPLILWSLFDNNNSIGLTKLSTLIFLLFNKILLVILAKQIASRIYFDKFKKIIFFLLLSSIFLTFVDYNDTSHFSTRYPLYLLFFNFFILSFPKVNKIDIINIVVGLFSVISILWWLDIGIFINLLIILLILFSFLRKEYLKIASIFIGLAFGWILLFLLFPGNELKEFLSNTISIFSTIEIINQIPYPSPFFGEDGRATKTLIYFSIAGAATIYFIFSKINIISNELKIFYLFLYIASLISFQYGLVRTDSNHLQMSTGLLLLVLSSLTLFYLFNSLKINLKTIYVVFPIIIIFIQLNLHKSIQILNFSERINKLIYSEDKEYLTNNLNDYNNLIKYYKELSLNDNCVQIFTDEIAIPFLVKRKSCTKFNIMMIASPKKNQIKFINELDEKRPEIILYNSKKLDFGYPKTLTLVDDYIKKNYVFHSKLDYWTFLKIK